MAVLPNRQEQILNQDDLRETAVSQILWGKAGL